MLQMVHELHKAGYQRLRIEPATSSSGCHWRCAIAGAAAFHLEHGAQLVPERYETDAAHYTTGQENEFFEWTDAKTDNARQLAKKFLERFPEICEAGRGYDWEYAGWFVTMLGFAENGELPLAYGNWHGEPPAGFLPTMNHVFDSQLPLPPPIESRSRNRRHVPGADKPPPSNSRERRVAHARNKIDDERLISFLHCAGKDSSSGAVEMILDSLGSGKSLDEIFYDGDTWGFTLDVDPIDDLRFSIEFGCAAGPTAGDGGSWEVEFDASGGVIRCEGKDMWIA